MLNEFLFWLGVVVFSVSGILGCILGIVILVFFLVRKIIYVSKANNLFFSFLKHRKYYKEFDQEKDDYYRWKNNELRKQRLRL